MPNGRITSGVTVDAAALKTLAFVQANLAAWRDDPERRPVERERELNTQLCKFLNVAAIRAEFAMVHFHHEEPQGTHHAADISANPCDVGWIEGRQFTRYDPILVMEGKRLPTPTAARRQEYVSSASGAKPAGGIQRFKLGLHGANLPRAGMIGYLQGNKSNHWFATVNGWIDGLAASADPLWSTQDRLDELVVDAGKRLSRCESVHVRQGGRSGIIQLSHLWVEM